MEQEAVLQLTSIITNITSPFYLSNMLTIEMFEEIDLIPRVRDLWILVVTSSPSHHVRFFILRIDVLFVISDKIVRIEHSGMESKALILSTRKIIIIGSGYGTLSMMKKYIMSFINILLDHM